jgi:hypothetical protein
MKAYGGVDVYIHIFLTSTLVGGEWSASRTGNELPNPLDRMLGGQQIRSGRHGEVKILASIETRIPTPRSSSRYTDYAIPAHVLKIKFTVMACTHFFRNFTTPRSPMLLKFKNKFCCFIEAKCRTNYCYYAIQGFSLATGATVGAP